MALNIKNEVVERLATEVAAMAGETKTEAVRRALEERKARLRIQVCVNRTERMTRFLEAEVWPRIPPDQLGRALTREEEDELLGYGAEGL